MRDFTVLMLPFFWSIKNDIVRLNRTFYKKLFLYVLSAVLFIVLFTKLLNVGLAKLHDLSPAVFQILVTKGYSLIFIILFFVQMINGFVLSLNTYYQSKELELLFISPVKRYPLFFSRLLKTHLTTSWMLIIFGTPLLLSLGNLFQAKLFFYGYSLVLFMLFSVIPVNIGIGTLILLSGVFRIQKLRKFVVSAGIMTGVIIITLLRLFQPERFVNPEFFANLKIFLGELKAPSFILLPNRWLSEALFHFLNKDYQETFLFIAILAVTAYITVIAVLGIYNKYHDRGWTSLQGGEASAGRRRSPAPEAEPFGKEGLFSRLLRVSASFCDTQRIAILKKDTLYQFHDIKNIQQNLVLLSLVIIYLFSIASLPVNWLGYGFQLKYIISFFNMGLILIIIASLCSKLIYPALVSEGRHLWIIKTAPITSKKFIRTKCMYLFIPIFILGQVLTVCSSLILQVDRVIFSLNIVTTTLLCCSLVGLSVFFGISDLRNAMDDEMKEEIKTGNILYMMVAAFLVLFTLMLEIVPLYLHFLKESRKIEFTQQAWGIIIGMVFMLIFLNILITAVALRTGTRRFDALQLD